MHENCKKQKIKARKDIFIFSFFKINKQNAKVINNSKGACIN